MKILHLITRLILGGAQENTVLSCLGQASAGHEVTLAFGPIYGPEGSLLARLDGSGVRTVELADLVRELSPVSDWRAYRQCRRLIAETRPDVVHTHSSKAGIVGRFAARAEGVAAVVHTIHGLPFHAYQSAWRNAIYVAAERAAAKRCDRIICVADAMARQALAAGVGSAEQYQTIYSGMEVAAYAHGARAHVREHDLLSQRAVRAGAADTLGRGGVGDAAARDGAVIRRGMAEPSCEVDAAPFPAGSAADPAAAAPHAPDPVAITPPLRRPGGPRGLRHPA